MHGTRAVAYAGGLLVLATMAGAGCASEPPVGNDPSQWELAPVDASQPYRMTVSMLLELADGLPASPPSPGWSEASARRVAREQATQYLAGVLDSGEQREWCVAESGVPPHEVDEALLSALRQAPGDQAAANVLRGLASARYPCKDQAGMP